MKATAVATAPAIRTLWGQSSPNNTVNIGVVGLHSRGSFHYHQWAGIRDVRVAYLCDIDERLFPDSVSAVEKLTGYRPKTEVDIRKLLENKDLDAISIAAPDHWHALATIWGCQAGKDVYVEKPVCYCLREGRKMVEAARKYNRIVQSGLDRRSQPGNYSAARFVQEGGLGKPYRAKAFMNRSRISIGRMPEAAVPNGVHWDLFLGPAPTRPFTLNRFHYGWHFFWDTSTAEMGNNGVHLLDQLRWSLGKQVHPVKIHSFGRVYPDDSDQETPHVQNASFEYADGTLLEIEVSTLPNPSCGSMFFDTGSGYVAAPGTAVMPGRGPWASTATQLTPRVAKGSTGVYGAPIVPGVSERAFDLSMPSATAKPGPPIPDTGERVSHFQNFIDCVRTRKREDLVCEILEGHMSTALCHLANISFRTGRKLTFDSATETIQGDKEANAMLTRKYRAPFVVPEKV
ncbi:MAG: Gfo/Idh/MocA family protein [Bryobacteraceae bacterium]